MYKNLEELFMGTLEDMRAKALDPNFKRENIPENEYRYDALLDYFKIHSVDDLYKGIQDGSISSEVKEDYHLVASVVEEVN